MKQRIRLSESKLHRIISETVMRLLFEDNSKNDVFEAIGFAEQYYTLWNVEHIISPTQYGYSYEYDKYIFIKNISKNKEIAFSKYPDAVYMEDLRGRRHSWETKPRKVYDNITTYRYGKYAGREISEVPDTNYLTWYYGTVSDSDNEHKQYVLKVLNDRGYTLDRFGSLVAQEKADELEKRMQEKERTIEELKKIASQGGTIKIFVEQNPDSTGCICDAERYDIRFYFTDIVERYYDGWIYYLPAIKGKGKRVKGKYISAKIWYGQLERDPDSYNEFDEVDTNGIDKFYITDFTVLK